MDKDYYYEAAQGNKKMNIEVKNFIIRGEHRDAFSLLSQDQKGDLLDAMFSYNLDGEEQELEGMVKMAFAFIKNSFDSDRDAYVKRCEANKTNGKKGGRPRREETQYNPDEPEGINRNPENPMGYIETEGFLEKPKKAHTNTKSNTKSKENPPLPPNGGESARPSRDFVKEWEFLRSHWNDLDLPEYKKTPINLPNFGEVKNWMTAYTLEEITEAITIYHGLLSRLPPDEPRYNTFYGFIRTGIDRFHSGAHPAERYESKEEKPQGRSATAPAEDHIKPWEDVGEEAIGELMGAVGR